ncbi:MAG: hypothetical protein HY000_07755 [Planctomycetes bacterium]|nr:hypothetical protein [Planctomycetota bacterium]
MTLGRLLRGLCVLFLAVMFMVAGCTVTAAWFVWRGLSRMQIVVEPAAVKEAMNYWVTETLQKGDRESKIQVIEYLGQAGPAVKDFVPLLTGLIEDDDEDAAVRAAAENALKKIDQHQEL